MKATELIPLANQRVRMRFADGQVVVAKILSVDPHSPGREVVYDVLEVLNWGSVDPDSVDRTAAAAAGVGEILEVQLLAE